jgi:membrane associated rhomboid family serine protease
MNETETLSTRIKMWWDEITILTKCIFFLCVLLYLIQLIFQQPETKWICFNSMNIITNFLFCKFYNKKIVYQIITSAFYHIGSTKKIIF